MTQRSNVMDEIDLDIIAVDRDLVESTANTVEYAVKSGKPLILLWPFSIKKEKAACEGMCATYKILATQSVIKEQLKGYTVFATLLHEHPPREFPAVAYARGTYSPWVDFNDSYKEHDWVAIGATLATGEIAPVTEDIQARSMLLVALLAGMAKRTRIYGLAYVWEKPTGLKEGDPLYITDIFIEDRPKWKNGEEVAYG